MFGYISWGEREYGNSCFLQRLKEPETEVYSFSIFIVSHPPRALTSCFRDDVMFCEGTAHTSTENKHYSCFLYFQSISLCSSLNVSDAGIGPVIFLTTKGSHLFRHSNSEATLASDEFTGCSAIMIIGPLVWVLLCVGFFFCKIVLL